MKYLISLYLLLMSCVVFAEGEEEIPPIWQQGTVIVIQVISLLILIYVLYKFLFKPITESIETRQKQIADAYAEAEESKKALKDANAIKERKIEEATAEIKRKTEFAENSIMNEKEKALTELKEQTGALGVKIASKILHEELTPQKHEDLINNFIKDLENEA